MDFCRLIKFSLKVKLYYNLSIGNYLQTCCIGIMSVHPLDSKLAIFIILILKFFYFCSFYGFKLSLICLLRKLQLRFVILVRTVLYGANLTETRARDVLSLSMPN